ncbi:MAG: ABC transporter permease [Anaerolineales bacterium]|nr:ABC transporter permease [Anaerolineales bacterium]
MNTAFYFPQLQSELRREWLLWYSYRFNAISSLIMWGAIFPILLLTLQNVVNATATRQFGLEEQAASLTGFLIWHLCMRVLGMMPEMITEEAQTGTLESVVVATTIDFKHLVLLRVLSRSVRSTIETLLLGVGLMWLLRVPLNLSLTAVSIIVMTLIGTWGAGFILMGLALLYQVVSSVAGLVTNLAFLISGAFVPINGLGWVFTVLKFVFPTTWGIDLLRQEAAGVATDWRAFLGLGVQTLCLLCLGMVVLHWALGQAKERGVLGSY